MIFLDLSACQDPDPNKFLLGSKAANLGLRKGKALLSVWMSPQTQVSTKDALNTIKTWSNSAATNLSKK